MESKDGKDYFHNYDFIVKWLADALVGRTLDVLGLQTAPIVDVFAFEIADINVRAGRVDVMVRDQAGSLFHIEEQRNLQRRDLYRFAGYHFLGAKSWGPNVTDVILASGDVDPHALVVETPSGMYRPIVVDFSQRDGKERLKQIRAQIVAGTFENWLELVVLPLYGKEKGAERSMFAEEVVRFQMELCRAERISSRLPAATLILSNKMIDRQRIEAMWEEIEMLDIIEIAREKGISEGKILGISEGKILGIEEGKILSLRETIMDLLMSKFDYVPRYIQEEIEKNRSIPDLKALLRQAHLCADMEAFDVLLKRIQASSRATEATRA